MSAKSAMNNGSDMQSSDERQILVARDFEGIETIRNIWEKMQADEPHPEVSADIDRYLTVIKATGDRSEPYIMVAKENGRPAAMLIGWVWNNRLKCAIGRKTLFRPLLRQLSVVHRGVIGDATDEICSLFIGELMKVLRRGEVDVVFFNHLRTDSSLYHIGRKMPGMLCRGHFPKVEEHWYMSIPDNVDQFLKACSHNRRKKLRRYTRKLEKEYPGQVRMVTYSEENEVAEAIEIAAKVSANTYQRAFGGGLVDDATTRALLTAAAKKDWLRIHILFIGDEPCAFETALQYGRTYFAELMGYSPKWRDWNVGNVLSFNVVEQLCGDPSVNLLDLGFGDGHNKQWGHSRQRPEASVFIFAPRLFPVFVNLVQSSTLGISILVQYVITKLGIRDFVQRYRRRRIMRKRARAKPQSVS
jgi:hypothetical protein